MAGFSKVAQLRDAAALRARLGELGVELPLDDGALTAAEGSPLATSWKFGKHTVGNRWSIQPMEGWDAEANGFPSELTLRRWRRFGESGAKLIWGGEAAAVRADGRANPQQLMATPAHVDGLRKLRETLVAAHRKRVGDTTGLVIGLQLTHSGRFSRPTPAGPAPRIAYRHPLLDRKFGIHADDERVVWTDDELERLIDDYVTAAGVAADAGYDFVDVKACHGYCLHEFLSARRRSGKFGGDLAGRSLLLRTIIARIQAEHPTLVIGVRLSAFDLVPFERGAECGAPMDTAGLLPYDGAFGVNPACPTELDLTETIELLRMLQSASVAAVNLSAGSPYYNPHVLRPAAFPPSDGYLPPEDPLIGVWRQLDAARRCREATPGLPMIGSAYSYLQEYLPHVAQAVVREGWIDAVGLGRMVLSYPTLPDDVLRTGKTERKFICRTFSDCTTAPRHGIVSGCYPLDQFYKERPEAELVALAKRQVGR
jgi:2,4-dienoyl-CoA reductase-like NADH-dependent reductase (Old Yellow Enzyme family)